ncbi:class I SAM-dependent methyltransferase [Luteimonas fraxinea]|uniref:Class I SAM-dependent methyltransferase n=1 Tax=Luteimonas fraxinea TaxID=2901869 RepID=A0ABS8UIH5_9GAMM|nr:class I SAM-dependent methyltransferase [Luteimonas fraxinea]MCD9098516.1 class I SAM-dependent methyltransferase [Luteimonas fraxinea]UHH10626.1 class I SAM-dependent methyltransferase [Luteimonas fraxinea]
MNARATDIDGYAADAAYPMHFHREQMPAWLHATATALGFRAPDLARPYRWCELGSGAGLTALVAAACNPAGSFTAVDTDAAQIGQTRDIAERAGLANLECVHADLRDYTTHDDESFDFIVSHGLWAWVSDAVRASFLAIVERRLAPGGLLELGYMSHPGASQLQGAQRLLHEAGRHLEGDAPARVTGALSLLRDLADGGAGFFAEHPGASRQLDAMEREPAGYIAHEFLGAHWQPQHVADVIRAFAGVDCGFLGSATPIENIDALSIPGQLQARLRTLPPGPLAETARDLARNQSLRRDLFQRDARRLDDAAHLDALDALVFAALPGAPTTLTGDLRFDTRIGPVTGARDLFAPALDALAQGPLSFAELRVRAPYDAAPGLLNQALQALTWAGFVHACLPSSRDTSADALSRQLAPLPGVPALALLPAIGSAALRQVQR